MNLVNLPAYPKTKEEYLHLCDLAELAHTSAEARAELTELTGMPAATPSDIFKITLLAGKAVPPSWAAIAENRINQRLTVPTPVQLRAEAVISPLARWRRAKNMTQAQLAEASGVPQPNISRLECGARALSNARGDTLQRLARAIGVGIDELLAGPLFTAPDA